MNFFLAVYTLLLLWPFVIPFYNDDEDEKNKESLDTIQSHDHYHEDSDELYLCKWCGREVFRSSEGFVHLTSRHAIQKFPLLTYADGENLTLTAQRVVNPGGVVFDLITTKRAEVLEQGHPVTEATWFDGYAWTPTVCPQCGRHVGWKFSLEDNAECPLVSDSIPDDQEISPETFYGLVLSKLTRENLVWNLVKLPKIRNVRLR